MTLAAFLTACVASPQPLTPPYPTTLPARQELAIWTHDSTLHLHGIRFEQDSVTGVSILRSPTCDSCRVSVPLASIDSVVTASTERDAIILVAIPILAFFAVGIAFALSAGGD